MGGLGSGNFDTRWDSKTTVEECLRLELSMFPEVMVSGHTYRFECKFQLGDPLRVEAKQEGVGETQWLHLWLYQGDYSSQQSVQITWPEKQRRWFRCPLSGEHGTCNRRANTLYLPRGGLAFGCRHCHDLTYESRRSRSTQADWLAEEHAAAMDARLRQLAKLLGLDGLPSEEELDMPDWEAAIEEFERSIDEIDADDALEDSE